MKKEDFQNAPKLFCESASVAYTPEYFVLGLKSGNQGTLYSLTPQHAKRLAQYLTHQVKEFEDKHNVIDSNWNPNIVSPVQPPNPKESDKST